MEATQPRLWCVNIIGPDDVIAAPNFKVANLWAWRFNEREKEDPAVYAALAIWPHSPESHAEFLAKMPIGQLMGCPVFVNVHSGMVTIQQAANMQHTFHVDDPYIKGTKIEAAARAAIEDGK